MGWAGLGQAGGGLPPGSSAWGRLARTCSIPLGGNRKGKGRTVLNKMVVFFCTGLWHGANMTFVLWGLYHGLFLMLETYFSKKEQAGVFRKCMRHVYTMLVVTVGFVLFRGETVGQGLFFIGQMFTGFHFEPEACSLALQQATPMFITTVLAAVICACPVKEKLEQWKGYETLAWIFSLAGLMLCMFSLSGNTYNPFIYFRF